MRLGVFCQWQLHSLVASVEELHRVQAIALNVSQHDVCDVWPTLSRSFVLAKLTVTSCLGGVPSICSVVEVCKQDYEDDSKGKLHLLSAVARAFAEFSALRQPVAACWIACELGLAHGGSVFPAGPLGRVTLGLWLWHSRGRPVRKTRGPEPV